MKKHNEILQVLKKIPDLYKEYIKLESLIAGTDEYKKRLSKHSYQLKILNFDAKEPRGTKLEARLTKFGIQLSEAKPDFIPAYQSIEDINRYIKAVGRNSLSDRTQNQLELLQLLEVQAQFQNVHDFLDDAKVKTLEQYLKGRV